mgnify:CR=1 FL=1
MSCGVIFVATGAAFVEDACSAAKSVRETNPSIEIDLFCDNQNSLPAGLFDKVHLIEEPHRRSKVDCLPRSRFERTLYLDSDVRVVANLTPLFRILERYEFAASHAHARNRSQTNTIWREEIPEAFPQLNGGVLLFKKCHNTDKLLNEWKASFEEAGFRKDQITLRELVWKSDLRLYILPPEYNVRYSKYLKVWRADEALPKILHFKTFATQNRRKPIKLRHRIGSLLWIKK